MKYNNKNKPLSLTRKCAMSRIHHSARAAALASGATKKQANEAGRQACEKAAADDWLTIVKELDKNTRAIEDGQTHIIV